MPIATSNLNKKLYDLLKVKGYDPIPKDATGKTTPVPDDADVIKFTFKKDGEAMGDAWVTIDSSQNLVIYYDDDVADLDQNSSGTHADSWMGLIQHLKSWAQRRQLSFELKNKNHLTGDMAQRAHMKKEEQMNEGIVKEGYYPMGKKASYSDNVPSVKIVLQHTRQVEEGEQRFRNVAKIFLENEQGERILAPTTRPGIARIYARHLAEGGMPHDDRWNHVGSLVEEYTKMAGFVRATRNGQFNESAQGLVEKGVAHYQALREALGKMTGHRGYNAYFESWAPPLMEDDGDTSNLSELFVQENLDPRIESVMPILSRLHKPITEMTEVVELAEWADSITETEQVNELSPKTLASYGIKANADVNRRMAKLEKDIDEPGADEEKLSKEADRISKRNDNSVFALKKAIVKGSKKNVSEEERYGDYRKGATNPDGTASAQRQADRERDALEYKRKKKEEENKKVTEEESLTSNNPQGVPESILEDNTPLLSKEDYMAKRKALQRLQMDPEFAKNKDLVTQMMRRKAALEKEAQAAGYDMAESEQVDEGRMAEASMLIYDLISGEREIYDVMNHPNSPDEVYVSEILNKLYDDVSIEHHLHPGDDFEEIEKHMVYALIDKYGEATDEDYGTPVDEMYESEDWDDEPKDPTDHTGKKRDPDEDSDTDDMNESLAHIKKLSGL